MILRLKSPVSQKIFPATYGLCPAFHSFGNIKPLAKSGVLLLSAVIQKQGQDLRILTYCQAILHILRGRTGSSNYA
jgi:hypothetical protein